MTSWGSVLMLYKHWCGYFWSSWTKWSSSTLSSISLLWNKASNYRPGYQLSSFLTWLTPDDYWKVDECSESNPKKSAARNHLKDGKSVRSCFECVFSQIIRLLQGCSITTSKLHWNDEQMGHTTSRPCANVVKIKVVVPAVVTRMNVEVSLWHRLKTVSEAVPSKAFLGNRLVYCMSIWDAIWDAPSPAMLGCLIWDLAAKLGRKTALALRSHKQDIQDTLSQYTHIGS